MACIRAAEFGGLLTASSTPSSKAGTRAAASPEARCLPRLTFACTSSTPPRSRSHSRGTPSALRGTSVEAADSSSHSSAPGRDGAGATSSLAFERAACFSLKAKSGLNSLAAVRSRSAAIVCSEEAVQSLPARALPAAAGAAALAVVGYLVASLMASLAHHVVSGLSQALAKLPPSTGTSRLVPQMTPGNSDAATDQGTAGKQQQCALGGSSAATHSGGVSDLLRGSRSASLVPSSQLGRGKASKRVPLVVSAASPSAIYEQNTEESEWHQAEPVSSSSLYAGFKQPAGKNGGRVPLVVSASAPDSLYAMADSGAANTPVLTGQEVTVKAVLDPTWVPLFQAPQGEDPSESVPAVGAEEARGNGSLQSQEEFRDGTEALAASLAVEQMVQMEKSQEQQIAAMKRAAALEAKVLQETHKKQLASLEIRLSAARKEASIASTIAKHLLESDSENVVTIKKGESASNGALPWHTPAKTTEPQLALQFDDGVLKFENMSKEMRELVRSFSSVLEMKLTHESAQRQAVEERLREAEEEYRLLKQELEAALAQPQIQASVQESRTEATGAGAATTEAAGSADATLVQHPDTAAEQDARSAYLADLRRKLADAQAGLFKERLRAEEQEKASKELASQLQRTVKERDALRLESFQNTAKELAATQELLAAQAKANLDITAALQHLMEEAPVLQAQIAEARMELEREREGRKADINCMRKAVVDARAEAAALRVEAVRMEEDFIMDIEKLQKPKGIWVSSKWTSGKA